MEDFVQMNVFTWTCTDFSHLIISCAIQYLKTTVATYASNTIIRQTTIYAHIKCCIIKWTFWQQNTLYACSKLPGNSLGMLVPCQEALIKIYNDKQLV